MTIEQDFIVCFETGNFLSFQGIYYLSLVIFSLLSQLTWSFCSIKSISHSSHSEGTLRSLVSSRLFSSLLFLLLFCCWAHYGSSLISALLWPTLSFVFFTSSPHSHLPPRDEETNSASSVGWCILNLWLLKYKLIFHRDNDSSSHQGLWESQADFRGKLPSHLGNIKDIQNLLDYENMQTAGGQSASQGIAWRNLSDLIKEWLTCAINHCKHDKFSCSGKEAINFWYWLNWMKARFCVPICPSTIYIKIRESYWLKHSNPQYVWSHGAQPDCSSLIM